MNNYSARPDREEIKELRGQRKKAAKALREKQEAEGLRAPIKTAMPMNTGMWKRSRKPARLVSLWLNAVTEQARVFRSKLPILLRRLSKIYAPKAH